MRYVNPTPEDAKFLLDFLRSALTEGSGEAVVELGIGGAMWWEKRGFENVNPRECMCLSPTR
jgi:hypothetical protein